MIEPLPLTRRALACYYEWRDADGPQAKERLCRLFGLTPEEQYALAQLHLNLSRLPPPDQWTDERGNAKIETARQVTESLAVTEDTVPFLARVITNNSLDRGMVEGLLLRLYHAPRSRRKPGPRPRAVRIVEGSRTMRMRDWLAARGLSLDDDLASLYAQISVEADIPRQHVGCVLFEMRRRAKGLPRNRSAKGLTTGVK